jgi:hypothetical protein
VIERLLSTAGSPFVEVGPQTICPKAPATNSTRARIVSPHAGTLHMSVLGVEGTIRESPVKGNLARNTDQCLPTINPTNTVTNKPPKLATPINSELLDSYLSGYSIKKSNFLRSGFQNGFSIGFEGEREDMISPNLSSANEMPDTIDRKIAKELSKGRIAGPYRAPPFPIFRTSPIGLQPKKTPEEYRLIHHLSRVSLDTSPLIS